MQVNRKHWIPDLIVPLLISVGVIVPLFYQVVVLAPQQPDNLSAFYSFSSGFESYDALKPAWKTRLFSNALAWQVDRVAAAVMSVRDIRYINRPQPFAIGLWTIGWFFLVCLVYILFLRRRSVLYILGTYAALTFGYVDKLPATRVYPWDMPALLVFVLFLFLFLRNQFKWIVLLLPLGMGFKETSGILCFAFLFADELSRKTRWQLLLASLALCVAVKLGIDMLVGVSEPFFTMETGLGGPFSAVYIVQNVRSLSSLQPLMINAGTLLSLALLPALNRKLLALKVLALLFAAGNFLFGTVMEYRIWFELIPFALYAIDSALIGGTAGDSTGA
jgi:hypothetical protein